MKAVQHPTVHQGALDFLRGIAALYVLVCHTRGAFYIGGQRLLAKPGADWWDYLAVGALQATSLGTEFVILFFVLSGFAMAHSVTRSASAPQFYLKRVIRIWPPYLAATGLAAVVGILVGAEDIQDKAVQVAFYIEPGTSVTPQFWSLPYEVVFYALCPFILANQKRIHWHAGTAVALTIVMILSLGPSLNPSPYFALNFLGNELLYFAAGALAYHHIAKLPRLSGGQLATATLLLLPFVYGVKMAVGDTNAWSSLLMVLLTVLAIRNLPERVYQIRWANLGYCSYSIYIFHYALLALIAWTIRLWGIEAGDIENPFAWLLVLPIVLGGSMLFYFITERPCNQLLDRIRARERAQVSLGLAPNRTHAN